jgi:hypothetical protein
VEWLERERMFGSADCSSMRSLGRLVREQEGRLCLSGSLSASFKWWPQALPGDCEDSSGIMKEQLFEALGRLFMAKLYS